MLFVMKQWFYDCLSDSPIIKAIKDEDGLSNILSNDDKEVIFLLYGDIVTLDKIVSSLVNKNKIVIVHIDLIQGLSSRDSAVDYIKEKTKATGIISTKSNLIERAKELDLIAIMRFFLLDSISLKQVFHQGGVNPDACELLPGLMPEIISEINEKINKPIIVGGLIRKKEDVIKALKAGAICVSSTNKDVWEM